MNCHLPKLVKRVAAPLFLVMVALRIFRSWFGQLSQEVLFLPHADLLRMSACVYSVAKVHFLLSLFVREKCTWTLRSSWKVWVAIPCARNPDTTESGSFTLVGRKASIWETGVAELREFGGLMINVKVTSLKVQLFSNFFTTLYGCYPSIVFVLGVVLLGLLLVFVCTVRGIIERLISNSWSAFDLSHSTSQVFQVSCIPISRSVIIIRLTIE